nr:MAG TPA: hypothetical protein [Caudoviricetes sp.]
MPYFLSILYQLHQFVFVLRCAFVVLRFLPMRYTGCTRRDVL